MSEEVTVDSWIQYAVDNKDKLVSIIGKYHPVNREVGRRVHDNITAPNAELACTQVRKEIRKNFEGNPTAQFIEALEKKDVNKVNTLLNQTWFGVPESRGCWEIEGFNELIHLVEELPEQTGAEGEGNQT
jgi:hypothetical protein